MLTALPRLTLFFAGLAAGIRWLVPELSWAWAAVASAVGLWGARLIRRLWARSATGALRAGHVSRARRWYWLLRCTSFEARHRAAVRLSLAACDAAQSRYAEAIERLEAERFDELEDSLQAVWLNIRGYCNGRLGRRLKQALDDAARALEKRPTLAGFLHTRGMVLLELGRHDRAVVDLERAWQKGQGAALFEAERCYDLGRLWRARGQHDYAADYFRRSVASAPASRWAQLAGREELGVPVVGGLEQLLE